MDSGSVTINGGTFGGNRASSGGAIYLNNGASLRISSNDFLMALNSADSSGAIYSNRGNVTIARSDFTTTPTSVSISFNQADDGGAICASCGKLSIDGIPFLNNPTTGRGGAVLMSNVIPPNPASTTRTFFRDNSAKDKGASIYSTAGSTLTISQDAFLRDSAESTWMTSVRLASSIAPSRLYLTG
jgi:predicted outer membrane repeat protein